MNEDEDALKLTRSDLKSFGWSDYLVKEICKDLAFTRMQSNTKLYNRTDIISSIQEKILKLGTKPETRVNLKIAQNLLKRKSNVIEVDFLQKLTSEQRIEFLNNYREQLRSKGKAILKDVDELLREAKSLR